MADLAVSIDADAVQQQIVEAIVAGSLGEKIQAAVNEALKPSFGRGPSVIDQAVAVEVQEQVRIRCRQLIREEGPVRAAIEEALTAALTPEKLQEIVKGFTDHLGLITTEDLR